MEWTCCSHQYEPTCAHHKNSGDNRLLQFVPISVLTLLQYKTTKNRDMNFLFVLTKISHNFVRFLPDNITDETYYSQNVMVINGDMVNNGKRKSKQLIRAKKLSTRQISLLEQALSITITSPQKYPAFSSKPINLGHLDEKKKTAERIGASVEKAFALADFPTIDTCISNVLFKA